MSEPDNMPADAGVDAGSTRGADSAASPSVSLVGRLFGVPLLIVVFIVGSVTVVVTGFGWIATGQEQTVEALLMTLEAGGGRKNAFGMLAPRDKEYWQAAQELAERLKHKDVELPAEKRPQVAARLAAMVARADTSSLDDQGRAAHQFLMLALARLGEPGGLDVLIERLSAADSGIRRIAAQALVELRGVSGVDRSVPALTRLVGDSDKPVRMVACSALGQIARSDDTEAVAALVGALNGDREVQWNAALALGHLKSKRAIIHLATMLDRSFWEGVVRRYETPQGSREQPLTPIAIRTYLIAAMRAASCLHNDQLDALIATLAEDKDLQVQQVARDLIDGPGEPAA